MRRIPPPTAPTLVTPEITAISSSYSKGWGGVAIFMKLKNQVFIIAATAVTEPGHSRTSGKFTTFATTPTPSGVISSCSSSYTASVVGAAAVPSPRYAHSSGRLQPLMMRGQRSCTASASSGSIVTTYMRRSCRRWAASP